MHRPDAKATIQNFKRAAIVLEWHTLLLGLVLSYGTFKKATKHAPRELLTLRS